ncbi:MAG: hypothetical protein U5K51_02485 [Flavobacteriaceae bacterium]|nr:hypothetical protein [Flavobacteriaceae bacterium]
MVVTAIVVLCLAVGTAWFLSHKKSEQNGAKFWTPAGRRFVEALFIPVLSGLVFCLALTSRVYLVFGSGNPDILWTGFAECLAFHP